jgi:hypothetical protein
MRRTIAATLATLALASCGGTTTGAGSGSVTGHVTVRACGGANQDGQARCPVQAFAGAKLAFKQDGKTMATATTDATGAYRLSLLTGTYSVEPITPTRISSWNGPRQVTIAAGKTLTADFTYTIQLL